MDNLDATLSSQIEDHERSPAIIDVTHLSPEDNGRIKLLESQGIITDSKNIFAYIVSNYDGLSPKDIEDIATALSFSPAWVFGDRTKRTIFVNTDIVKDSDLIPPYLRHEAVEIVMSDRNLDPEVVASQIGIDPEIIENDRSQIDSIAHYVALYHEIKLANDNGAGDKLIDNIRKLVGSSVRDVSDYFTQSGIKQNPAWKGVFKSQTGGYAKQNFLTPKKMLDFIRSNSKQTISIAA